MPLTKHSSTRYLEAADQGQKHCCCDEVEAAVSFRRQCLIRYRETDSMDDYALWIEACRQANRAINSAKQDHWNRFCSALNARDTDSKIWRTIRALSGKSNSTSSLEKPLEVNNKLFFQNRAKPPLSPETL